MGVFGEKASKCEKIKRAERIVQDTEHKGIEVPVEFGSLDNS